MNNQNDKNIQKSATPNTSTNQPPRIRATWNMQNPIKRASRAQRKTGRHADMQQCRQADRQTSRQADMQACSIHKASSTLHTPQPSIQAECAKSLHQPRNVCCSQKPINVQYMVASIAQKLKPCPRNPQRIREICNPSCQGLLERASHQSTTT